MRKMALLSGLALCVGCRSEGPDDNSDDTGAATDDDGTGTSGGACGEANIPEIDESSCTPLGTDYQPRINMSADDMWASCITDDGEYHLVDATPSSIARVEAYETIADLLWRDGTPSEGEFTAARTEYALDEGLESRLVRREDLHYPEIPMADWDPGVDADKQCTVEANVEKYPDRCAGPAKIAPLIQESFAAGQTGDGAPDVHAARIQASILWFYYLSAYKECFTCTLKAKDCDSCWAYYTGGFDRSAGIALSGVVKAVSDESHQSIWDGFTAVRCWRDLYPDSTYPTWDDVPMDGQDLHGRAWEQLDNALHRGFALVVRDRLQRQASVCGTSGASSNWAFLQVAGPVLDREARERDSETADTLAGLWAMDDPGIDDIEAGVAALDLVFPCSQP